jgi:hypothetical protein
MSLREEIQDIFEKYNNSPNYDDMDAEGDIIKAFEKRIDRIIEDEYDRMLTQGHSFSSEYGLHVTEIPVDKVKEMLK